MSTELAVVQEVNDRGEVQVWKGDVPESLMNHTGFENGTLEDQEIPRLALAQALTAQTKKNNEMYIEGLGEGEFFNNLSQKVYGPSIRVIPVAFSRNRILFENKEQVCRSDNGVDGGKNAEFCANCEYQKWGTGEKGKGTACTLFRNFVCYIPEDDDFAVFSLKKSTAKLGKLWYTTAQNQRRKLPNGEFGNLSIFGCEYMFTAKSGDDGEGEYQKIGYKRLRDVTDLKLLGKLAKAAARFKTVTVVDEGQE